MKITIQIEAEKAIKKPIDEWDDDDNEAIDEAREDLPPKTVVLPKDESMMEPGQNAKPLKHIVKKGETLKQISERYSVSYGELSNHLMNTQGSTSIKEGQEIEIPRHFIDLSHA